MTLKFSHNRIVFGEGPERWSITDPESEALHEAAHRARSNPQLLTTNDLFFLASVASDYHYLGTGGLWGSTKLAVGKLKDVINAVRSRARGEAK